MLSQTAKRYTPGMRHQTVSTAMLVLVLAGSSLPLAAGSIPRQVPQQQVTPAPNGPFHIDHAQIVDSKGHSFLMRGTQLPVFRLESAEENSRSGQVFGSYSATSLTALRLRFNMNTVRLPLDTRQATNDRYFSEAAKVVRLANNLELLVVIAAHEPDTGLPSETTQQFWSRCATVFKDYPNVMFDAFSEPSPTALPSDVDAHSAAGWQIWRSSMNGALSAIRSAGAKQPVLAMAWADDRLFDGAGDAPLLDDPNVIYEVTGRYADTRTDAQRDARFGLLASHVPVATNGWDLDLEDAAACATLPSDPGATSDMVRDNLDYLDQHRISWTMSLFVPGKLVKDLSLHDATTLESGFTCGPQKYPTPGLGRILEGHLRGTAERSLFVVSAAGGVDLARGGFANGYGPVMAEREVQVHGPLPLKLAGITVEVTDSAGITRRARISWVSAGWGQINFVIPDESAAGPARMTLVRDDGSRLETNITIADTVPGFRTGLSCRGAAIGFATQVSTTSLTAPTPISTCEDHDCRTLAIPMTNGATTTVQLVASGVRHANAARDIEVTIAGVRVPVLSYGPSGDPGFDQLTVKIPASLRGIGETDLIARLNGRVANPVRVRIGGAKPVS